MSDDTILRAEDLTRTYGRGDNEVHALAGVSLQVAAGELVILRGPSGSGKTTLLNILGGLDKPTSGTVQLGDRDVVGASESDMLDMRRREIGFIFQNFALLPSLTAAENVELPMRIAGVPYDERATTVSELLDIVGLTPHSAQRPFELSGGQQQRLGIARALANSPRLIIADEPTGQLDATNSELMMTLISALVHQRGVAALVSTHDPRMAAHADRILELRDGRLAHRRGRHALEGDGTEIAGA